MPTALGAHGELPRARHHRPVVGAGDSDDVTYADVATLGTRLQGGPGDDGLNGGVGNDALDGA